VAAISRPVAFSDARTVERIRDAKRSEKFDGVASMSRWSDSNAAVVFSSSSRVQY